MGRTVASPGRKRRSRQRPRPRWGDHFHMTNVGAICLASSTTCTGWGRGCSAWASARSECSASSTGSTCPRPPAARCSVVEQRPAVDDLGGRRGDPDRRGPARRADGVDRAGGDRRGVRRVRAGQHPGAGHAAEPARVRDPERRLQLCRGCPAAVPRRVGSASGGCPTTTRTGGNATATTTTTPCQRLPRPRRHPRPAAGRRRARRRPARGPTEIAARIDALRQVRSPRACSVADRSCVSAPGARWRPDGTGRPPGRPSRSGTTRARRAPSPTAAAPSSATAAWWSRTPRTWCAFWRPATAHVLSAPYRVRRLPAPRPADDGVRVEGRRPLRRHRRPGAAPLRDVGWWYPAPDPGTRSCSTGWPSTPDRSTRSPSTASGSNPSPAGSTAGG